MKTLSLLLIMLLSSCSVFNKQAAYLANNTLQKNPCWNDRCDLKNALEMLQLTKPNWSTLKFTDSGLDRMQQILSQELPKLTLAYKEKGKTGKTEQQIIQEFLKRSFNEAKNANDIVTSETSDSALSKLTKWLFGLN